MIDREQMIFNAIDGLTASDALVLLSLASDAVRMVALDKTTVDACRLLDALHPMRE
jgi:hypothetical protein